MIERNSLRAGLVALALAAPAAAFAADADAAAPMMSVPAADFAKMAASSDAFGIRSSELAQERLPTLERHTMHIKEIVAAH